MMAKLSHLDTAILFKAYHRLQQNLPPAVRNRAGTDDLVSRNEIPRTEIDELAQVSNTRNSFDAMRGANVLAM
jgi:hypothetical protein